LSHFIVGGLRAALDYPDRSITPDAIA
jgi:hypothetical protein